MSKKEKIFLCCALLGAAILAGLDQVIKHWAATVLSQTQDIRLIDGVLHLLYIENYGAAFSILQNKTVLLVTVTTAVLLVLLTLMLLGKVRNRIPVTALSLIISGGAGNLIDRIARGYVVDYVYFVPINFPVFNLADCCVVIGTGLLLVYLLIVEPKTQKNTGKEALEGPDGNG